MISRDTARLIGMGLLWFILLNIACNLHVIAGWASQWLHESHQCDAHAVVLKGSAGDCDVTTP